MPQYACAEEKNGSGAISKSEGVERMRFKGCQNYIIWLIPVQFSFTVQRLLFVKSGKKQRLSLASPHSKVSSHKRLCLYESVCGEEVEVAVK